MKRVEIEGQGIPEAPVLRRLVAEAREKDLAAFAFSLLAGPRAPWKITVTLSDEQVTALLENPAATLVTDPSVTAWRVV